MSALYTIIAVVIPTALLIYIHRKYVRISLPQGEVIRQECLPEEGGSEAEMEESVAGSGDGGDGDSSGEEDAVDEGGERETGVQWKGRVRLGEEGVDEERGWSKEAEEAIQEKQDTKEKEKGRTDCTDVVDYHR